MGQETEKMTIFVLIIFFNSVTGITQNIQPLNYRKGICSAFMRYSDSEQILAIKATKVTTNRYKTDTSNQLI